MGRQSETATKPATSKTVACIVGNSAVQLWGLGGAERLARQLRAAGIADVRGDNEIPADDTAVLLVRGDYLFDDRIVRNLAERRDSVVTITEPGGQVRTVAAHVSGSAVSAAHAAVRGTVGGQRIPGVTTHTPASLSSSSYMGDLLKAAAPMLLPIRAERADALERHLFDGAYKGVTDLVTKWVWPTPARWMTKLCARLGIAPNTVTAASWVLVVAAMFYFARGEFGLGLVLAWIMTFLDTVDGKLARVTVTSTPAGHLLDHLLDLFHPPLWYIAWAYGVTNGLPQFWTLLPWLEALVVAYIVGRLAELGFKQLIGGFSLFTWRPADSYFRLIMARRNPNLLLLTAFALAGLPKQGLVAVTVWTVGSSVVLVVRLGQAVYARIRHGRLHPWLEDVTPAHGRVPSYARPFAANGRALTDLME